MRVLSAGELVLQNQPMTTAQIAGLRNAPVDVVEAAIGELRHAGLVEQDTSGTLYLPELVEQLHARKHEAKRKFQKRKMSGECPVNVRGMSPEIKNKMENQTARIHSPTGNDRQIRLGRDAV